MGKRRPGFVPGAGIRQSVYHNDAKKREHDEHGYDKEYNEDSLTNGFPGPDRLLFR